MKNKALLLIVAALIGMPILALAALCMFGTIAFLVLQSVAPAPTRSASQPIAVTPVTFSTEVPALAHPNPDEGTEADTPTPLLTDLSPLSTEDSETASEATPEIDQITTSTPTEEPTPSQPQSTATPTVPPPDPGPLPDVELQEALVTEVIDGDTIRVLINDQEDTVRYILVDTPETKHPDKPVEPFGPEASAANEALVDGQTVYLERDVSERDRFDRLLRYVYLADGRLVNEELLRQGLARVAVFEPDVKYRDRFFAVEAEAQVAGLGLWSGEGVATEPTPASEPTATSAPAPTTGEEGVVITTIFYDGEVSRVESDEYIEIANRSGRAMDLSGWKINAGNPGQDFIFPADFTLQPDQTCRVYTDEIHPDSCAGRSFASGQAIWNNGGDVGTLYDGRGAIVSEWSY